MEVIARRRAEHKVLERMLPPTHTVRNLRSSLSSAVLAKHIDDLRTPQWDTSGEDPETMFRLYLLQTILGIETEQELMLEVHVNTAYQWFCGFGISEEIYDKRLLADFRRAVGQ